MIHWIAWWLHTSIDEGRRGWTSLRSVPLPEAQRGILVDMATGACVDFTLLWSPQLTLPWTYHICHITRTLTVSARPNKLATAETFEHWPRMSTLYCVNKMESLQWIHNINPSDRKSVIRISDSIFLKSSFLKLFLNHSIQFHDPIIVPTLLLIPNITLSNFIPNNWIWNRLTRKIRNDSVTPFYILYVGQ